MIGLKGGVPRVMTVAVPSGGGEFAVGTTSHLTVQATGSVQLYFTQADFNAGQNFITVSATTPYDGPASVKIIWLSGSGNVTIIAYQRV